MGRLDDRVVIITGAAKGQGAAEARMCAAEGATVVVTDVLDDAGERVADDLGTTYHHLDVSSANDWQATVDTTLADHGRIDGLVNNAGIFRRHDLVHATEEIVRQIFEINQLGVFLGMHTVAPSMIERRSGSIVNISSIAGLRGLGSIAYVGSKFAVTGMSRSAARQLAPHQVRVNSVHPGAIDTEMMQSLGEAAVEMLVDQVPLGRAATADEVASTVLFLLSDESSYVSGTELVVDGAMIA